MKMRWATIAKLSSLVPFCLKVRQHIPGKEIDGEIVYICSGLANKLQPLV